MQSLPPLLVAARAGAPEDLPGLQEPVLGSRAEKPLAEKKDGKKEGEIG